MCDPVTMAVVMTATTVMAAKQQIDQGKFQEGTAKYNARVAENESQDARNAATAAENTQRQRTAALLSKQRAQLGAAGVDLNLGSAAQLQEDTVTLGEVDALRIRDTGDAQFAGLQSEATLTEAQGKFAAKAGRNAAVSTLIGGGTSALGTGVADKWLTKPARVGTSPQRIAQIR